MGKVIQFKKRKDNETEFDNEYITIEEIKAKIKKMIEELNRPFKVFYSKTGERYTQEENEQIKRMVMKLTCQCMSCTYQAKEMKKYWPNRTESSLLAKISEARKKYYNEIEFVYGAVCYGGFVVKNQDKLKVNLDKINPESYIFRRILELVGLIPEGKELEHEVTYTDETTGIEVKTTNREIKEYFTPAMSKALDVYAYLYEDLPVKNLTFEEAAKLLDTTPAKVMEIARKKGLKKLNTKDIFVIAVNLKNEVGSIVREKYASMKEYERIRKRRKYRGL